MKKKSLECLYLKFTCYQLTFIQEFRDTWFWPINKLIGPANGHKVLQMVLELI